MKQERVRILIDGRLHGANFRLQTQQKAQQLNLVGFVRNLTDGRIEIEAQGDEEAVQALLNWCQDKPHSDNIKNILFRFDEPDKNYPDFSVR